MDMNGNDELESYFLQILSILYFRYSTQVLEYHQNANE